MRDPREIREERRIERQKVLRFLQITKDSSSDKDECRALKSLIWDVEGCKHRRPYAGVAHLPAKEAIIDYLLFQSKEWRESARGLFLNNNYTKRRREAECAELCKMAEFAELLASQLDATNLDTVPDGLCRSPVDGSQGGVTCCWDDTCAPPYKPPPDGGYTNNLFIACQLYPNQV